MALTRSQNMARIRSSNTRPEALLRRALWAKGARYRIGFRTAGGRADVAFPSRRAAIFVDGCFWHGCPEHYVRPRGADGFWAQKLRENTARDQRQTRCLIEAGWLVIRLWEHDVLEDPEGAAGRVLGALTRRECYWAAWRVVGVDALSTDGAFERRHLEEFMGGGRRHEDCTRTTAKVGRVRRGT